MNTIDVSNKTTAKDCNKNIITASASIMIGKKTSALIKEDWRI